MFRLSAACLEGGEIPSFSSSSSSIEQQQQQDEGWLSERSVGETTANAET